MNNLNGNENNSNIRALANQQFLDDALQFRTGLQERLMRKINSNGWQKRYKIPSGARESRQEDKKQPTSECDGR